MNSANTSAGIQRRPLVGLLLALPVLLVLASWLVLRKNLPATVAIHWSGGGLPDGFGSTTATLLTCLAISLAGGLLGAVAMFVQHPGWQAAFLFTGGLAAWCAAAGWLVSSVTTTVAGDPQQAWLGAWVLVLVPGTLLGLAPVWLNGSAARLSRIQKHARDVRIAEARGTALPTPLLEPGTPLRATVNAPAWLWVLSAVMVMLVLVLAWLMLDHVDLDDGELVGLLLGPGLLALVLPLLLGLCRITIRADEGGLRVSSAQLGFPLRRIRLEEIKHVRGGQVNPAEWGGWGWRLFPGGSAVVFKSMQGLIIHTVDGKRFAVTMPEPEIFRDRLLALREHHG